MRENADENNSEYRLFSHSVVLVKLKPRFADPYNLVCKILTIFWKEAFVHIRINFEMGLMNAAADWFIIFKKDKK